MKIAPLNPETRVAFEPEFDERVTSRLSMRRRVALSFQPDNLAVFNKMWQFDRDFSAFREDGSYLRRTCHVFKRHGESRFQIDTLLRSGARATPALFGKSLAKDLAEDARSVAAKRITASACAELEMATGPA